MELEEQDDNFSFDDAQKSVEELEQDIEQEGGEVSEEEAAPVEEEAAAPEKSAEPRPAYLTKAETDELKSELIKKLGAEAQLKVKGKTYSLKDLPSDEVTKYIQLGLRSGQVFQELSDMRRDLESQQAQVRAAAEQFQQYRARTESVAYQPVPVELPRELQPSEFDTEETLQLKNVTAQLFQELTSVKDVIRTQQRAQGQSQVMAELASLEEEYPMMSPEEVVAVKATYPRIPIDKIAEVSHAHYASKEHLDQLLKASPELRRELKEGMVAEYLAGLQSRKVIPSRPSGLRVVKPTSPQKRIKPEDIDFDMAEALARAQIASDERSEREERIE